MNQFGKCRLNESEELLQNNCEESIDAIFDLFDLDTPQVSPEVRRSGRKRKFMPPLDVDVNPKRQKYLNFSFFSLEKKKLLEGVCCETETYLHYGLFQHYITSVVIS